MKINRRQLSLGTVGAAMLSSNGAVTNALEDSTFDDLWRKTLHELLKQDLWTERDGYDSAHYLMIPMHVAFRSTGMERERTEFDSFFSRFSDATSSGGFDIENQLIRVQFLLLVSRYLRLKQELGVFDQATKRLAESVVILFEESWTKTAAPHLSHDDFSSVAEMTEWKLENPDTPRDFDITVVDLEMFCIAIGADLSQLHGLISVPQSAITARKLGLRVFEERGVFAEDGRWQFQPGYWWDHPDNAYAGHLTPEEGMESKTLRGVASDASHSHRLPVLFECFMTAESQDSDNEFIASIREGLAKQFVDLVLVAPGDDFPGYRTTNYMDGYNGIYRWNYLTQGEGNGYLAWELSGTFLLGWWSMLRDEAIQSAYVFTDRRFPLSQEEIDLYVGPNTTRARNPIFALPDALQNGMLHLCVKCAASVPQA